MTVEKNIDANKLLQDKFADERLSDNELENVAGGTGEGGTGEELNYGLDVRMIINDNTRPLISYETGK